MKKLKKKKLHTKQYVEKLKKRQDYIQYQNTLPKMTGSIMTCILQILQEENHYNR